MVVSPAIVVKRGEGGDHAKPAGWAHDSSELGACSENGNSGALDCYFLKPGGKLGRQTDFDPSSGVDAAKTKAMRGRISAKGYGAASQSWAFAQDMTIEWKTSCDEKTSKCILRVGGKDKSGAADFPMYIEIKDVIGIHLDGLALSPDSKQLGVVAHGAGGEGNNKFELRVVAVGNFVGQIYNDIGMSFHKKKDYKSSARYFERAAQADPGMNIALYNYACALAQQKHPDTEKALKSAIDAGGPKVKPRAAKDGDFAGVASEAWFVELTK